MKMPHAVEAVSANLRWESRNHSGKLASMPHTTRSTPGVRSSMPTRAKSRRSGGSAGGRVRGGTL